MSRSSKNNVAEHPQHCGRPMLGVKDRKNDDKPIWYCADCGHKAPREETIGEGSVVTAALVLERLPSGEHAWLRPDTYTDFLAASAAETDDATSTLTQLGEDLVRREAAMQACFGPAPTVAEACGLTRGVA